MNYSYNITGIDNYFFHQNMGLSKLVILALDKKNREFELRLIW